MTEIERLARVAHANVKQQVSDLLGDEAHSDEFTISPTLLGCRTIVRAILEAMKTPSEGMLAAMVNAPNAYSLNTETGQIAVHIEVPWQAAIDAILSEKPE